ncbi:MAG: hypothetical protein IJK77_07815 [Lachnospiraceae bacterium]|nr:hypothetical protein [Lachnospiraceae bacterium]
MQIKQGGSWKAAYNEAKGVYGAQIVFQGSRDMYEISGAVFSQLTAKMSDSAAEELIRTGRHIYSHVNDQCGPPYTVILDEDYVDYCPWAAKSKPVGKTWNPDLTDAAVELFESEKANRPQRRKKREQREGKKNSSQ